MKEKADKQFFSMKKNCSNMNLHTCAAYYRIVFLMWNINIHTSAGTFFSRIHLSVAMTFPILIFFSSGAMHTKRYHPQFTFESCFSKRGLLTSNCDDCKWQARYADITTRLGEKSQKSLSLES